jgi:hypothetical protein
MSRSSVYCAECGARLTLYVVGVCPRCEYDLTGEDESRDPLEGSESDSKETKWPSC